EIAEGEVVALLGASGSGKTTTLRLIAGLETPDSGEIWLAGQRVAAPGRNLVPPSSRGVGFVFQDLALWPHLTVAGNLNFVLQSTGVPKSERAVRIRETLRPSRIGAFAESHPGRRSGGEQQRFAIARAIIGKPKLLLLDEPLAHLDTDLKNELIKEIAALQKSLNVTTVYITHDRREATRLANRIVEIGNGKILGVTEYGMC